MNKKVVTASVALLALWPFANPITADAKPITEAEKRHCEQRIINIAPSMG
jgi:hypothetical protein